MTRRLQRRTATRQGLGARLRLVLLALSVLVDPVLASGTVLMHSHGDEGLHQHVLPSWVASNELAGTHDWHADAHGERAHQHQHLGQNVELHDEDSCVSRGHLPPGVVVELPGLALGGSAASLAALSGGPASRLDDEGPSHQGLPHCLRATSAGTAPRVSRSGSGVTALLRSNHALLI